MMYLNKVFFFLILLCVSLALIFAWNRGVSDLGQLVMKSQRPKRKAYPLPKHLSPEKLYENWNKTRHVSDKNTVCTTLSAGEPNKNYPKSLKKSTFADTRFVFVVGLEGTGHHLFKELLRSCHRCISPPRIRGFKFVWAAHRRGLFGAGHQERGNLHTLEVFNQQVNKAIHNITADGPKTIFVNTLKEVWVSGEVSYPNYYGPCRDYQYPDVRLMAEMFENNNIDFRIVLMLRNAVDILLSTTVHRKFSSWNHSAELYTSLINNVILDQQLLRLDEKFVQCMDYDKLPYIDDQLGDFLGINTPQFNLKEAMAKNYHRSADSLERTEQAATYQKKDVEKTYVELEKAMQKLKDFCKSL